MLTPRERFDRLRHVPGAQVSLVGDEIIWHGPGPMPDAAAVPEP